jgi:hypothetical protein
MANEQSLHAFHNIYADMTRDLRTAHCPQFSETSDGPQHEDKARLNKMLVDKTITAIETAPSGCMVDQALRDLRMFQSKICTKLSNDQRRDIIDAVDARTARGISETNAFTPYQEMWKGWRESTLRMLGDRPAQPAPRELSIAA